MDYTSLEEKMKKSVSVYEENLAEVRAGRANPSILNKIKVDYYGVPTPINQVAGISVPEARLIVIQPWDLGILKEIEKYTGVLEPLNFKGVKQELENKNLLEKADDYLSASGHLAAILYKEEIERAMKTPGISNF